MKFLHLADLHIGKSVNGFSMLDEQRHVLRQIHAHIQTEDPAAVIIAGDVYDRAVPGVEAVRLFDDFLTELAGGQRAVMVVSGNHDSPDRLNYASRLLRDKGIFLYGAFDGSLHRVILSDEYGGVSFWLLPFIKPLSVESVFAGRGVEHPLESYDDALLAALEHTEIDYAGRNVLVAHQFFTRTGSAPLRSESEMNFSGGLDAMNAGYIEQFDYAALGHLHGAQKAGAGHIRYAGSPLKYSFSECRQEKSVTLVELRKKGSLDITALPLTPLHDMREIKGALETLTDLKTVPPAGIEDYLRVILTNEEEIIDPLGRLRSVYPNVMSLEFENSRTRINMDAVAAGTGQVKALSPQELFGEFFLDTQGAVMSAEQAEIVRELLETKDED